MPETEDDETAPEPDPEPETIDGPALDNWDVPLIDPETGEGWDEPVKAASRSEAAARAVAQHDGKAFVARTFIDAEPADDEEDD